MVDQTVDVSTKPHGQIGRGEILPTTVVDCLTQSNADARDLAHALEEVPHLVG